MTAGNVATLAAAWLGALGCLPLSLEAEAQAPATAKVTVTIRNVQSDAGTIIGQLCTDPAAFGVRQCADYRASAPARTGSIDLVFENVKPGNYAFAAFHDLNGDGTTQIFSEPFAFGNDSKSLPPVYDEAILKVTGDLKTATTLFGING